MTPDAPPAPPTPSPPAPAAPPSDLRLQQAICELIARRAPSSTICPSEVARALAPGDDAWRALMPRVRDQAAALAAQQRVHITRRAESVDPGALHRGAIRLGRGPRFDDPGPSDASG